MIDQVVRSDAVATGAIATLAAYAGSASAEETPPQPEVFLTTTVTAPVANAFPVLSMTSCRSCGATVTSESPCPV